MARRGQTFEQKNSIFSRQRSRSTFDTPGAPKGSREGCPIRRGLRFGARLIEKGEYDRPEFVGADQLQGASIGGPLPKALIGRGFKNIDFHDRFSIQKTQFWLPAPQSTSDSSGAPKGSIFWRVVWLGDAGFEFLRARFTPVLEGSKFRSGVASN